MALQPLEGLPRSSGGEPCSLLARFEGPTSTGQFHLAFVQVAAVATAQ